MTINLATIDTPDARALAVNAERARMMQLADQALPRQYRGNPAALLVAFEYADSLGIPRIAALTGVHIVDGKPTASADLIAALVRKAGHKLRVSGDETYAEAVIIRADDPEFIPNPIRWDEARATKAGLWDKKGPWQYYPGAMLRARAITEAARMWASESLFGVVYTPEELGAPVDDTGELIIDGEVVHDRPGAPAQQSAAREQQPPARGPQEIPADVVAKIVETIANATSLDDINGAYDLAKGFAIDDTTKADLGREVERAKQRIAELDALRQQLSGDPQQPIDVETADPEGAPA